MRYLSIISLLAWFIIGIYSIPYDSTPIKRRDEPSTRFTTSIRLANGTDVTTAFKTMVYWQPDTPALSNSSLHGRQVYRVRRIDSCQSRTAQFIQSRCQRVRGLEVSVQNYIVLCREPPPPQYIDHGMNEPIDTIEEGTCEPNELCVEDTVNVMATCVNRDDFIEANKDTDSDQSDGDTNSSVNQESQGSHEVNSNPEGFKHGHQHPATGGHTDDLSRLAAEFLTERALGNRKTSVIVSAADGTTPLNLQNLEVDLGIDNGHRIEKQKKCDHCFGLRTQRATANTDTLMTKATLLATTAVTGIVWITVFAG